MVTPRSLLALLDRLSIFKVQRRRFVVRAACVHNATHPAQHSTVQPARFARFAAPSLPHAVASAGSDASLRSQARFGRFPLQRHLKVLCGSCSFPLPFTLSPRSTILPLAPHPYTLMVKPHAPGQAHLQPGSTRSARPHAPGQAHLQPGSTRPARPHGSGQAPRIRPG